MAFTVNRQEFRTLKAAEDEAARLSRWTPGVEYPVQKKNKDGRYGAGSVLSVFFMGKKDKK